MGKIVQSSKGGIVIEKKDYICLLYTIFLAAIMFEAYCFLELRKDLITVICGAVVVLISGFLFLDVVISCYHAQRDYLLHAMKNYQKETKEEVYEILKFQKGIYLYTKKQFEQLQEGIGVKSDAQVVESIHENQMKAAKVVTKSSKENLNDIITISKENNSALANLINSEMDGISKELKDMNTNNLYEIKSLISTLNNNIEQMNNKLDNMLQGDVKTDSTKFKVL